MNKSNHSVVFMNEDERLVADEAILNEATRRAYAQVGRPEQAGHG